MAIGDSRRPLWRPPAAPGQDLTRRATVFFSVRRDGTLAESRVETGSGLLAFDRAVNVTVGLPTVRTSPDHGTAYDIAGTNQADPGSMQAAIGLALDFVDAKRKATV